MKCSAQKAINRYFIRLFWAKSASFDTSIDLFSGNGSAGKSGISITKTNNTNVPIYVSELINTGLHPDGVELFTISSVSLRTLTNFSPSAVCSSLSSAMLYSCDAYNYGVI